MRYLPKLNLNKYIDEDKILNFPERFNFKPELNRVWKKLFQNQDIGMYDICTEVFGNNLDRETFEKLRKEIYDTLDLCIGYFIQEGFSIYEIADKFQKMNFRYIKYLTDPYFGFSGTEYVQTITKPNSAKFKIIWKKLFDVNFKDLNAIINYVYNPILNSNGVEHLSEIICHDEIIHTIHQKIDLLHKAKCSHEQIENRFRDFLYIEEVNRYLNTIPRPIVEDVTKKVQEAVNDEVQADSIAEENLETLVDNLAVNDEVLVDSIAEENLETADNNDQVQVDSIAEENLETADANVEERRNILDRVKSKIRTLLNSPTNVLSVPRIETGETLLNRRNFLIGSLGIAVGLIVNDRIELYKAMRKFEELTKDLEIGNVNPNGSPEEVVPKETLDYKEDLKAVLKVIESYKKEKRIGNAHDLLFESRSNCEQLELVLDFIQKWRPSLKALVDLDLFNKDAVDEFYFYKSDKERLDGLGSGFQDYDQVIIDRWKEKIKERDDKRKSDSENGTKTQDEIDVNLTNIQLEAGDEIYSGIEEICDMLLFDKKIPERLMPCRLSSKDEKTIKEGKSTKEEICANKVQPAFIIKGKVGVDKTKAELAKMSEVDRLKYEEERKYKELMHYIKRSLLEDGKFLKALMYPEIGYRGSYEGVNMEANTELILTESFVRSGTFHPNIGFEQNNKLRLGFNHVLSSIFVRDGRFNVSFSKTYLMSHGMVKKEGYDYPFDKSSNQALETLADHMLDSEKSVMFILCSLLENLRPLFLKIKYYSSDPDKNKAERDLLLKAFKNDPKLIFKLMAYANNRGSTESKTFLTDKLLKSDGTKAQIDQLIEALPKGTRYYLNRTSDGIDFYS